MELGRGGVTGRGPVLVKLRFERVGWACRHHFCRKLIPLRNYSVWECLGSCLQSASFLLDLQVMSSCHACTEIKEVSGVHVQLASQNLEGLNHVSSYCPVLDLADAQMTQSILIWQVPQFSDQLCCHPLYSFKSLEVLFHIWADCLEAIVKMGSRFVGRSWNAQKKQQIGTIR